MSRPDPEARNPALAGPARSHLSLRRQFGRSDSTQRLLVYRGQGQRRETSYPELAADPSPKTDPPPMTYRKGPQDEYDRAGARYWGALAGLERTGIRGHLDGSGFRSELPADTLAEKLMPRLFADAVNYRREANRRHAIHRRVLSAIPPRADLVIIAHSLGSVVAADLLYRLPDDARLRMLVTLGSPLGLEPMREHLDNRRNRFPYEVTGPWVNLAGTSDFVTGFRGLSPVIPEALDVFVDTGSNPRIAHDAWAYLDLAPVARALEWLDQRHERHARAATPSDALPDLHLPEGLLSVVVGAQYALRLEQAQEAGNARVRFGEARALLSQSLADRVRDAGFRHPVLDRLAYDNASYLERRFGPQEIINLVLTAWTANPIMPYEINVPKGPS